MRGGERETVCEESRVERDRICKSNKEVFQIKDSEYDK